MTGSRQTVPVGSVGRRVAASIRANRLRHGWSTEHLADEVNRLGCPTSGNAITKIEGGTRRITVDELVVFATALGVDPADMLIAANCGHCGGDPGPWKACLACGAKGAT